MRELTLTVQNNSSKLNFNVITTIAHWMENLLIIRNYLNMLNFALFSKSNVL